ncbi:MAG: hypothetical protein AAGC45_02270 [Bacteroidota bacterium]
MAEELTEALEVIEATFKACNSLQIKKTGHRAGASRTSAPISVTGFIF